MIMLAKCGRLEPQQVAEMQRRSNQAAVGQFCVALRALEWSHEAAGKSLGVSRETVWRWTNELTTIPGWAVARIREIAFESTSIRPMERTGT